jgi:hypothetical protein
MAPVVKRTIHLASQRLEEPGTPGGKDLVKGQKGCRQVGKRILPCLVAVHIAEIVQIEEAFDILVNRAEPFAGLNDDEIASARKFHKYRQAERRLELIHEDHRVEKSVVSLLPVFRHEIRHGRVAFLKKPR